MEQYLYFEDNFSAPFAGLKTGQEVTIEVRAVVANAGAVPTFENVNGKPEARQMSFTQFVIKSVSKGGKTLATQSDDQIEQEIMEAKMGAGEDDPDENSEQRVKHEKRAAGLNRFLEDGEAMRDHVGDLDEANGFQRGHSVPADWGPEDLSKRPKVHRRQVFTR